jgi:hypothetical protein
MLQIAMTNKTNIPGHLDTKLNTETSSVSVVKVEEKFRESAAQETKHVMEMRQTALEFCEGIRQGWGVQELIQWIQVRLVQSGKLRLNQPNTFSTGVREDKSPAIFVPIQGICSLQESEQRALQVIMMQAHQRCLRLLSGLLDSPQDDRFISAAIYAGRVQRVKLPNRVSVWEPRLMEGEALSDWVLAFFVCDALQRRESYEQQLTICETCNSVSFQSEGSPRRCASHLQVPKNSDIRPIAKDPQPQVARVGFRRG